MDSSKTYPYDVALSFAGEDRSYADALAEALQQRGLSVFYDTYEKFTLWGKNLYTYLSDVYQNKARYCVMFLSKHYAAKLWTNHEREAAQARAFRENEEYILPIRLDDTEIPGLLRTTGYLNWHKETIDAIADGLLEKLGKSVLKISEIETAERTSVHALSAEHEMQLQQQMMGVIDFRQAITSRDWKQAENILQKYPNLPQGRSLLGLSMSYEVQEYFSYQLHPGTSPQVLENLGGPVTPLYYTQFAQNRPTPPTLEAIHWLEEALQYYDNPEGNVTAALALMYGFSEAYDKMIDNLQKALTFNPFLISCFQLPNNLMMLIHGCSNLASVEEVMRNVKLKLPQKDEVQQALSEASDPKKNPYALAKPYMEWYAVEFRMGNSSWTPAKVLFAFPRSDGATYAQISKQGQVPMTIPTQPTTYHIQNLAPVDEILKQLTKSGIVLIVPI